MTKPLRELIADKIGEYGRLRRGLLFASAAGVLLAGLLNAFYSGEAETPPWAIAAQIFGLFVAGGVALFLAVFEDNSADLVRTAHRLEDERDATATARREAKANLDAIEDEYRYSLELYQTARAVSEYIDPFLTTPATERTAKLPDAVMGLLDLLVERKGRLLGIGDERWTFNVFAWNSESQKLEMLACRRWTRASEDQGHRQWEKHEGHVGLTFAKGEEQVCEDSRKPEINGLIAPKSQNVRDDDKDVYVSYASLPIKLGAQEESLGVLVATSDMAGRYLPASQADDSQHSTVEALRVVADTLATLLYLAQIKDDGGTDGRQEDPSEHSKRCA